MKKLVGVVVFGGVTYVTYRTAKSVIKHIPFMLVIQGNSESKPDLITKNIASWVMRQLPYAGFCEITGCGYEVHTNLEDFYRDQMSKHLIEDH